MGVSVGVLCDIGDLWSSFQFVTSYAFTMNDY